MTVRFGNLSTLMFENKVQVDLTPEDMQWIEAHRVDKADFKDDNGLHIFDLPLGIVAGANIGEELLGRLKAYNFKRLYVETKEPEIISDPQAVASV
jgi:hypothetical protein